MSKYHMNRADGEIDDPDVIRSILSGAKYLIVSMCADNRPYVVTLSSGYDAEANCVYFHCALKGRKIDILRKNPSVCATVIDDHGYVDGDCSHKYRSLVVWGTMAVVDSIDEKRHGFDVLFRQLESDPDAVRARSITGDAALNDVGMLKLEIESVDCKGNL